ncbi:protein C10-like [Daphnia carinata]|uniref:protein C10-like n=1 Tax=Daphnia carinata TaxID=120202 RepID=UPI00257E6E60|nr:protein C10-like [Daphnia carinata]
MNDCVLRFDAEKAREACNDILTALSQPGNAEKLARAREVAGTDMVKVMREVFPIVTQIQLEVIQRFGFPGDGEGAAQFLQLVRSLEKEDGEVSRLSDQLRAHFLPPMTAPIHSIPASSSPQCNGASQP